mgnify:CR=1 FL=1
MALNSIWNNSFYNHTPIPKWSFEVDFTQMFIQDRNINVEKYGDYLNKAVVSCSWPAREAQLIETWYAGINSKFPGRATTAKDLVVTFNENSTMRVTKILEELFHAEINCDSYFTDQEGYAFNNEFNKTSRIIRVLIHKPNPIMNHNESDKNANIVAELTFHNCIMYKIDETDLSYESDEVIKKTATFSFDYMTVKSNKESDTKINNTCKIDSNK